MKIKKGDNITVITGSDKGKKGNILKVFRATGKIVVEGVNIKKVHKKKTANKAGAIIELPMPIDASNVKLNK